MEYSSKILNAVKAESYVSRKVISKSIPNKGTGLVAIEKISKGEIVSISGGLILSSDEYTEIYKNSTDHAYNIHEGFVICPLNPENPSDDWRMNHCCEPNCGVKGQIVFVALRDINIDEELTFDYAMTETDPEYSFPIDSCEKTNCRKCFSGNDWKNPEIQNKYKGYFSLYIQDKIDSSARKI
jgi:uncharacterized protein